MKYLVRPAMLSAVSLMVACGGGGGGEGTVATETAAVTTVSGTFTTPDGTMPLARTLVYVKGSSVPVGEPASDTSACGAAPDASWAAACTAADGSFSFQAVMPATEPTLVLRKGPFEHTATLPNGQPSTQALGKLALSAEQAGATTAVVAGEDAVQHTLAKLGMGTIGASGSMTYGSETFRVFSDENNLLSLQAPGRDYETWEALFEDDDGDGRAQIFDFTVLFLNSGSYSTLRSQPDRLKMLRDWVEQGGRLVAIQGTDGLIEDTFPEFIDWKNSESAGSLIPETLVRIAALSPPVYAEPDLELAQWLGTTTCARYLGVVDTGSCFEVDQLFVVDAPAYKMLPGNYPPIAGVHTESLGSARILIKGEYYTDGVVDPLHPLAATFTLGSGRVTYASFAIQPKARIEGLSAHQRFLQYVLFEL